MQMVVFHLIVGLETGGAENMLLRLVSALPRHKHIIVSLTKIGLIGDRLIESGHAVHAIDLRPLTFTSSLFKLWKLIRSYRPDVIQTWMYHSDLLGGLIGRFAGVRNIVWNVRNTEIPQRRCSVTGLVVKLCAALSHWVPRAIVCCSHAAMKSHVALGYNPGRMIFIPNGYDSKAWAVPSESKSEIKRSYQLPLNSVIIGIVGRFDRLKGYDVFVEAAALLSERCRHNALFVMVGRNIDDKNAELSALIAEKGGRAQFKLMGEWKNVSRIMYALDIFCLASRAEGFPNVVAEAMLMQVPCVVTDVGDAGLIVGTTGKVVPPNRPAALADALLSVENMVEAERLAVGRDARKRILEQFDIGAVADRYEDLYINGI
jgi:glycosyltransferase involved in cell wall biosynthesis